MRASLRCGRCKAKDINVSRITLPYSFPLQATVYQGFPGKGPHEVLASCNANTYGYVLFDWLAAKYPDKAYTLTDEGRVLKRTEGRKNDE